MTTTTTTAPGLTASAIAAGGDQVAPLELETLIETGSMEQDIFKQPIPHDDARCRYKPYNCVYQAYVTSLDQYFQRAPGLSHPFSRLIRIRLMKLMLEAEVMTPAQNRPQGGAGLKLGYLVEAERVSTAFVMHDENLRLLLQRKWIFDGFWPWEQPLELIRVYFGEKVALYFGFGAHISSNTIFLGSVSSVCLPPCARVTLGGPRGRSQDLWHGSQYSNLDDWWVLRGVPHLHV